MKQQIHINDQGELLLIEAPEKPKYHEMKYDFKKRAAQDNYDQAFTSAIEKGIKFRDQEVVADLLFEPFGIPYNRGKSIALHLSQSFDLPNYYTAQVEYGDEMGIPNTNYQVAVLTPLKQELKKKATELNSFGDDVLDHFDTLTREPGNEAKKDGRLKIYLVQTKQLLIVGCFSTEDKAKKYAGNGDVMIQEVEVF